jgi:hypothetical protein
MRNFDIARAASFTGIAVVLAACQVIGSGEAAGFGGTGSVETPFNATGPQVLVRVAVSLERGTADLRILDSTGVSRYQKEIDPGHPLDVSLPLEGPPGRWVVALAFTDSHGTRLVEWHER